MQVKVIIIVILTLKGNKNQRAVDFSSALVVMDSCLQFSVDLSRMTVIVEQSVLSTFPVI